MVALMPEFLSAFREVAIWMAAIAAFTTATRVIGSVPMIRRLFNYLFISPITKAVNGWADKKILDVTRGLSEDNVQINEKLNRIEHELSFNSGQSVKDKVYSVSTAVETLTTKTLPELQEALTSKLDTQTEHLSTSINQITTETPLALPAPESD